MAEIETVDRRSRIRISWSAVFGGFFIALGAQILLTLFGLGLGFTSIDPMSSNPFSGLAVGAIIWLIASLIISMFIGGYASGRLAGAPTRFDGALNGAVVWALFLATTLFLTGNMLSGLLGTVGSAAGQGLQAAAGDIHLSGENVAQILRDTGKPALQPEALKESAGSAAEQASQVPTGRPGEAAEAAGDRLEQNVQALDADAVANVIANNTDLTQQEARNLVEQGRSALPSEQQVRQTAADVTDITADAAWALLIALSIALIAGLIGGAVGAPQRIYARQTV